MIIIMAVILVALSAIYFMQVKQMQEDFAIERDTLTSQLTSLLNDYDTLKTLNDTLSVHYEGERQKADSLLQTLQKERQRKQLDPKENPGLPPARRVGRGEIAGVVDEGAAGFRNPGARHTPRGAQ